MVEAGDHENRISGYRVKSSRARPPKPHSHARWPCALGLFLGMIGPGYDDYAGIGVIPAALFGAFLDLLLFRPRRQDG